jgi:hypothetical protein
VLLEVASLKVGGKAGWEHQLRKKERSEVEGMGNGGKRTPNVREVLL